MLGVLAFGAIVAIAVVSILYLKEVNSFFLRLKEVDAARYTQLGAPKLGFQLGDKSYTEGMRFIRSKAFLELGDDALEGHFKKLQRYELLFVLLFVALLVFVALG